MLNAVYSTQFKKDFKLAQKRNLNMQNIINIMKSLETETPLLPKHNEHSLNGKYKGALECHIEPDWLLIYRRTETEVYFVRTGSHGDLF